jgi:GAF domain-containing protein
VDLSTFFSQVALELHDAPDPERTIDRIAHYAQATAACDDAGIMLVHARRHIETAAATSQRVTEADGLQIIHDEGPCLDAIEGHALYLSADVGKDERWRIWGPATARLGIRSVLSLRLQTRSRRYGSLNLYADKANAFDDDDVAVATIFVRHASVALANADNEDGLHIAIDARKLIGQAQGIVMERFDIDADRAFDFLRRQSQHHNIKLRDIAQWVVEQRGSSVDVTAPEDRSEHHTSTT